MFRDPARTFRLIAIAEAISWLGLLISMLFKYALAHNPVGVKIFGPIHGTLFIAYLLTLMWLSGQEKWGKRRLVVGALAAVPPFTSVIFERWVARRRQASGSAVVSSAVAPGEANALASVNTPARRSAS